MAVETTKSRRDRLSMGHLLEAGRKRRTGRARQRGQDSGDVRFIPLIPRGRSGSLDQVPLGVERSRDHNGRCHIVPSACGGGGGGGGGGGDREGERNLMELSNSPPPQPFPAGEGGEQTERAAEHGHIGLNARSSSTSMSMGSPFLNA